MIQHHLNELRAKLEQSENITEELKAKLLDHVTAIENETSVRGDMTEESEDSSTSANTSTHAGDLLSTVEELEASHPELVGVINRIAVTLSNMGI